MSQNIEYIKDELSYQEKFLEKTIKFETFFKKYKKILIAIGAIIIVSILAYVVDDYIKQSNLEDSNRAYLNLQKDPNDNISKAILKDKNPNLYNIFLFQNAINSGDINELEKVSKMNITIASDLAKYQVATLEKDIHLLGNYSDNNKAILRDLTLFQEVFLLIEKKKYFEAKNKLAMIDFKSPIKNLANFLEHYLINKK